MKLIANRDFLFAITTVGYKESIFLYDDRELMKGIAVSFNGFLAPFNREIWVTLIVTLTLSTITLSLTESGGSILKIPTKGILLASSLIRSLVSIGRINELRIRGPPESKLFLQS
jgi:hypothetical protein